MKYSISTTATLACLFSALLPAIADENREGSSSQTIVDNGKSDWDIVLSVQPDASFLYVMNRSSDPISLEASNAPIKHFDSREFVKLPCPVEGQFENLFIDGAGQSKLFNSDVECGHSLTIYGGVENE